MLTDRQRQTGMTDHFTHCTCELGNKIIITLSFAELFLCEADLTYLRNLSNYNSSMFHSITNILSNIVPCTVAIYLKCSGLLHKHDVCCCAVLELRYCNAKTSRFDVLWAYVSELVLPCCFSWPTGCLDPKGFNPTANTAHWYYNCPFTLQSSVCLPVQKFVFFVILNCKPWSTVRWSF